MVKRFKLNPKGMRRKKGVKLEGGWLKTDPGCEGARTIFREVGRFWKDKRIKQMLDLNWPLKVRVTTFSPDKRRGLAHGVSAQATYSSYKPYAFDMIFLYVYKCQVRDKNITPTQAVNAIEWVSRVGPSAEMLIECGPLQDEHSARRRVRNEDVEAILAQED